MNHPNPIALARLINAIAALPSSRFVGFTYAAKESGEVANHVLIVGASYENTVRESAKQLDAMLPSLSGIAAVAAVELSASFAKSLACMATGVKNSDYTKADTYAPALDSEGNEVAGVRVHKIDGSFEVAGLAHSKSVITPATKPTAKPVSEKAIAKAVLRRALPIGKFRTLCLDAGCLDSVRVSGEAFAL